MLRSLLASLTGFPSDTPVLEAAALVGKTFAAHIDAVHVSLATSDSGLTDLGGVAFLNGRTVEQLRTLERSIAERSIKARQAFDEACARHKLPVGDRPAKTGEAASAAYSELVGMDLTETIRQARHHDLTVIARDSRNVIFEPDRAGTIMLGAGRPVLVPPRKAPKSIGENIVIAWKGTAEAARAVACAMPFIRKAGRVFVLGVAEDNSERLPSDLRALVSELEWHGAKAVAKTLPVSLSPAGESLLDEAFRLDADLLVMGGYGHSRIREIVFGGMTREILSECEITVLMSH